jgi:hypothetical protein
VKTKTFRQIAKESLDIRAPRKLADQIREKAARERRSISSVGVELLARGLDLDPAAFGIEPMTQR